MGISTSTVVRTVVLGVALANQILTAVGKPPLPVGGEDMGQLMATLFTVAASLAAWWKNNSFTVAAIKADALMLAEKAKL